MSRSIESRFQGLRVSQNPNVMTPVPYVLKKKSEESFKNVAGDQENCALNTRSLDDAVKLVKLQPDPLALKKKLSNLNWHGNWYGDVSVNLENVEQLLQSLEHWVVETKDEAQVPPSTKTTQLALGAVYHLCLKESANAERTIMNLKNFVFKDLPAVINSQYTGPARNLEQVEAFKYISIAAEAALEFEKGDFVKMETLLAELEKIDLSKPKVSAAMKVLKSNFYSHFGYMDLRMAILEEAYDLDDESVEVSHFMFRAVRKARKDLNFIACPTPLEFCLASMTYHHASTCCWAVCNMAVIYEDIWKSNNPSESKICETKEDITDLVLQFSEIAMETNSGSISVNVRYAQLCYKLLPGGMEKAERHFKKCLKKWPRSSELLHKVGKFYCCGKSIEKKRIALDYFRRGLNSDPQNFPCYVDYIKTLYALDGIKALDEILAQVLAFAETARKNRVRRLQLLLLAGGISWKLGDTDDALKLWTDAITEHPECNEIDLVACMAGKSSLRDLTTPSENRLMVKALENHLLMTNADPEHKQLYSNCLELLAQEKKKWQTHHENSGSARSKECYPADSSNWRSGRTGNASAGTEAQPWRSKNGKHTDQTQGQDFGWRNSKSDSRGFRRDNNSKQASSSAAKQRNQDEKERRKDRVADKDFNWRQKKY